MTVQGLKKLNRKLTKSIPDHVKRAARAALQQGAQDIVATAKNFAPKKTGALRDSIGYTFGKYSPENANVRGVKASGSTSELSVTIHAGDKTAWYAALVEFGTAPHTIKPKRPGGLLNIYGRLVESIEHPGASKTPFFFPAYRANKRRVKSRVTRAINKAVRDGAK